MKYSLEWYSFTQQSHLPEHFRAYSHMLSRRWMESQDWKAGDGQFQFPKQGIALITTLLTLICRIFILEGIFTVFLSFFIWSLLPDSPSTAPFLTTEEREFIVLRLEQDTGSGRGRVTNNDKVSKRQVIAGLTDWKVWAAVVSAILNP